MFKLTNNECAALSSLSVEVFTRGANVLDKAVLHREKEKFFFLEFYAVHGNLYPL